MFYNIRERYHTIHKEYANVSKEKFNYLYKEEKNPVKKTEIKAMIYNFKVRKNINHRKEMSVVPGFYEVITHIVRQLQNFESDNFYNIDYIYHPFSPKTNINLKLRIMLDLNGSNICYCLGYHPDKVLSRSDRNVGENIVSLNLYQNCFIYTDIFQNQLVGDIKAPLLRVKPPQKGDFTYVHYDSPRFLYISPSNISTIEINIKDTRGDLL